MKLELTQNRVYIDDACLSLKPMCRLAHSQRLTPRKCARVILECLERDAPTQRSGASACRAVAAALGRLRGLA